MNPQVQASLSLKREYAGHPLLGTPTDSDTWLTPRYILDHLGAFDLDPCAAETAPHWVCLGRYTKREDGLSREWGGRVFMNPPFSQTSKWLRHHAYYGRGISLVSASVESVTWRECVWTRARAIYLLHGRTRFCNPDGSATVGRPLRSIALIAWAREDAEILETAPFVLLNKWRLR